ncbi:dTDP-4-amino-4,6-dideoxygalactose transaminase [Clostridium sediminicola]|uniref:dTDP-4-amino-4,6-dideoxygalactose transaminase n=1 Tax=Clostridium sediminicola TaxID=3114879 RepID=UPI0031F1FD1F
MNIKFNKPFHSDNELQYIQKALEIDSLSGDGYYTNLVTNYLENRFDINKLFMTTSATHALEMAALLIGIKPGDQVIIPSFTFPSTANAFMLFGAEPVFVDINPKTLCIDLQDVKNKLSSKTKAIVPVHYAGISCNMDELKKLAKKNNTLIIEDAAQAVNSYYKDKPLGTLGEFSCYSYHSTKNYSCGEGGSLLINTKKKIVIENAEIIRQKGTNRKSFVRGDIDKYCWCMTGSSYVPSDVLMAILYSQLESLDDILEKRKIIHDYYHAILLPFVKNGTIKKITYIPEYNTPNYHLFYIILHDKKRRDLLKTKLQTYGITSIPHYVPLHTSVMGKKYGFNKYDLPNTDDIWDSILRLPIYPDLTKIEIEFIGEKLVEILKEF